MLLIVLALAAIVGIAFVAFGGVERVTSGRIERALVTKGIPQPIAACMGQRMSERLSLNQLRKLENLSSGEDGSEGETQLNMAEFLERLRRVDDREAIDVTASSAAICAFSTSEIGLQ